MAGTALENGASAAPCVSALNGDIGSQHVIKQKNGIRKGFLNKPKTSVMDVQMSGESEEQVSPEYVPTFSPASPPSLVAVDTTSMNLQWKAVAQTGLSVSPPAGTDFPPCSIAYILQMQQVETRSTATGAELAEMCKSDKWTEVYKGTVLITQVHALRPGRRYAFRLVCSPVVLPPLTAPRSQPTSQPVAFATPATVPVAPQPVTLSGRGRTNLTFKWKEPEDTGGRDIFEYHLQMAYPGNSQDPESDQGFTPVYEGEEKRYKAARLLPGNEYKARVKAVNIIGESPWSQEAAFMTEATVPSPPEFLTCTANGADTVLVSWQAPPDGGAPIHAYQVHRGDGMDGDFQPMYNGSDCQYQATGLLSGLQYRFRVRAENEEGKGNWSDTVIAQTAAVPPDSPSAPTVLGSNRTSVSIRWDSPEADGGSAVTSYEVELRPKSKAGLAGMTDEWLTVYQGEATACTMGCLYAGCVYRVRIRAQNASGWGQYSVPCDVKAAAGVPHPPTAPKAVGQSAVAIELAWEAPQHDGGSDIISYRLEMSSDASASDFRTVQTQAAAAGCRADVLDLTPGTQYRFQVYAVNSQGASPASNIGSATTRPAPPLAPHSPNPSAISASSFKLSWASSLSRGAPVTEYLVSVQQPAAIADSNGHNPVAGAEPAAMSNGHADANGNGVMDSMDDASSTSGSTAHVQDSQQHQSGHAVQTASPSNGSKGPFQGTGQWHLSSKSSDSSVTIKGLQPFTEYSCQLQAGNSAGYGDWSEAACVRTAASAPSAPVGLQAYDASSSSLSVQWHEPEQDHGSPVTGYLVEYATSSGRGGPAWQKGYSGQDNSCTITRLRPGRGYSFRARAQNGQGQGPWSQVLQGSTAADMPGAPSQPVCSKRTASGVNVRWEAPEQENGAPVVSYRLQCRDDSQDFEDVYHGSTTQFRVQGLEAGSCYHLRVQAANTVGRGEWSAETSFATTRLPPQPPCKLECSVDADPLQRPKLMIRWEPTDTSSATHADVASHEVELTDQTATSAKSARQQHTCSGKVQEHSIANLMAGTQYQVRVRKGGPNPAEADGLLPGQASSNKAKKSARKAPGTGLVMATKAKIPPEVLAIYPPKFLVSRRLVSKRVVIGRVPERLMPFYMPCKRGAWLPSTTTFYSPLSLLHDARGRYDCQLAPISTSSDSSTADSNQLHV
ncbi:hypothetical protein WJX79_010532 [Trebouxia sp. C0005]